MIKVMIVKMVESSGNIHFFGRAYNAETKKSLDYAFAQTKDFSVEECLERVWLETGFLARFFAIKNEDIELIHLTDEEKEFIVKQLSVNHT